MCAKGVLVMSVDKDTAEQLGLQGRPSRYLNRHRFSELPRPLLSVYGVGVM